MWQNDWKICEDAFMLLFVCALFAVYITTFFSNKDYIASNTWIMNLKEFWRKRPWPNFKVYPCIRVKGLRKITKNLSAQSVMGPRFEPGTSRIRSKIVNQSITTFLMLLLLCSCRWVRLCLWTATTNGLWFTPRLYQYGDQAWCDNERGKPKNSEETCSSDTLPTTDPTYEYTDQGTILGVHGDRPATKHLSRGTACLMFLSLQLSGSTEEINEKHNRGNQFRG
jgi:hypothetical protein